MNSDVFSTIINSLGEFVSSIGLGWLAIIGLGLAIVTIVISFIVTQFSIEIKTARAVNKINHYIEMNPFVTEENLVEFNKLMKHIPQPMRLQWQQYMVNRDRKPSEFFTDSNCIDRPFKSSAYGSQIVAVRASFISLAVLMIVFTMSYNVITNASILTGILSSLLIGAVLTIVCELYLLFLKARRNSSLSDLYYNFASFQKYIDRACSTLPDYVDYEILFTRKEITNGIPVLQEYLQQRAIFEQEQIQKAKESQVVHENYDFSALGINGSLVMERAMRESEYVIGNQRRILAEISELEGARDMLDKSYDEKNKNSQRKLRDIQESLDRLKEKLDNTTNLIVGNDLRKQRENEIQKQRQLEKEAEEDNRKYEADKKQLNEQIQAKRAEIDEFKKNAESTLNNEFKTYADKIYKELMEVCKKQVEEQVDNLNAEKVQLEKRLEEQERLYVEKSTVCDEKSALAEEYSVKLAEQQVLVDEANKIKEEFEQYSSEKDQEIFDTKRELESRNLELEKKNDLIQQQKQEIKELKSKKQVIVNRYFDAYGNEIFYDDNGAPYILDVEGQKKYIVVGDEQNNQQYNAQDELHEESAQEVNNNLADAKEFKEDIIDLKYTDSNIVDALGDKPADYKEEEKQPTLEELKTKFKKPVYDFQWENSNSQQGQEAQESEGATKDSVAPQSAEDLQNNIDEIDKMIEEQNAELEKQNQELSKQLEETQKVAEEQPKRKKKRAPAKKKSSSKSNKKKTTKKPASKSKKQAKPVEVDFNLESFNEQLNNAIDEIGDDDE